MIRFLLLLCGIGGLARGAETAAVWEQTVWRGEKSFVSSSGAWKAIISLERGRLVFFGPGDTDTNLLFASAARNDPAGWGGHRLWLGPQANWSGGWPPPAAWERSGAESFSQAAGWLRLVLPAAGDGWPRLTRTYGWDGARLLCGAEISGGTRAAQVVHIIQVPPTSLVDAQPKPEPKVPLGYAQLPSTVTPRLTTDFAPPPHVTPQGTGLRLRHLGRVQKLGFPPQPLNAQETHFTLRVNRRAPDGTVANVPDAGLVTQVYLGGTEPFIELEQLSPAFSPGTDASFVIELEGVRD